MYRRADSSAKATGTFRLGLDVVSLSRVKRIYEKRPCLFMKRFYPGRSSILP